MVGDIEVGEQGPDGTGSGGTGGCEAAESRARRETDQTRFSFTLARRTRKGTLPTIRRTADGLDGPPARRSVTT